MRDCLLKMVAMTAVTAISVLAADNSLGTWKRNIDKSNYSPMPPNPLKNQTTVREAADGGVKVTNKGQRADGTPVDISYIVKYDGKPVSVTGTGSSFDTISMKQIDANTFTSQTRKTGGKYHTLGMIVISADGKVMTNTSKGTGPDGNPISFTIVYDKQ